MLLKSSRYVSSPLPSDIRLSSLSMSLASTCEDREEEMMRKKKEIQSHDRRRDNELMQEGKKREAWGGRGLRPPSVAATEDLATAEDHWSEYRAVGQEKLVTQKKEGERTIRLPNASC